MIGGAWLEPARKHADPRPKIITHPGECPFAVAGESEGTHQLPIEEVIVFEVGVLRVVVPICPICAAEARAAGVRE